MLIDKIRYRIFPRSLLARILLIIILPTIAAQCISTYMFYSKHWNDVKRYMIYTLAGEIAFISEVHSKVSRTKMEKIKAYTFLQYKFHKKRRFIPTDTKLPKELRILKNNLQYNLPNNNIDIKFNKYSGEIEVDIQIKDGVISFDISKKRVYASSTYIFIFWMLGSTLILLTLAILFAKNQIKSITKLSTVATKFSEGRKVKNFIPHGAIEVRNAGYALLKMKEKIEIQVKEKTKILAGVSHDLKTPLTRFKLELELMDQNKHSSEMKKDIMQMEKTINDYLEFARGENLSSVKLVNLNNTLKSILTKITPENITASFIENNVIYLNIKENQFRRAIANLVDNAVRFAKSQIVMKLYEDTNQVIIELHDDGPGVSNKEIGKLLEPFYRVDNARNQDFGGVGLGLSISNDIVSRHKGTLELLGSHMGGLLILIKLPKG